MCREGRVTAKYVVTYVDPYGHKYGNWDISPSEVENARLLWEATPVKRGPQPKKKRAKKRG